ncbi:MAG: ABC transporter permease [Oscillospiraceae bacterium]|nr:ABC transporter permease [Oscillospiraceae bacterium]
MKNNETNLIRYCGDQLSHFAKSVYGNKVVFMFVVLCIFGLCTTGKPLEYTVTEVFTRFGRNTFIVLSLIIPVIAGLGLNFGIVVGAMAAQIAIFCTVYWGFTGIGGLLLTVAIATPISLLLGFLVGRLYNKTKGTEMITGLILGYFADGLYQFLFLFLIGVVFPVENPRLIIDGGVGVKNTIDLAGNLKYTIDTISMLSIVELACLIVALVLVVRLVVHFVKKDDSSVPKAVGGIIGVAAVYAITYIPAIERFLSTDRLRLLDAITIYVFGAIILQLFRIIYEKLIKKNGEFVITRPLAVIIAAVIIYALTFIPAIEKVILSVNIPVMTYVLIALLCVFNTTLLNTKLGQNMRTVGQSRTVANAAGINVNKTRIIAMMLSTMLAAWGQIIYLQNIGTFSTYGAHSMCGQYAIAALLVGGASVKDAKNSHAILGVILFHTLFVVSPLSASHLFGNSMIGEYFRVFVCYGVIAVALAMHAWKTLPRKKDGGEVLSDNTPEIPVSGAEN